MRRETSAVPTWMERSELSVPRGLTNRTFVQTELRATLRNAILVRAEGDVKVESENWLGLRREWEMRRASIEIFKGFPLKGSRQVSGCWSWGAWGPQRVFL